MCGFESSGSKRFVAKSLFSSVAFTQLRSNAVECFIERQEVAKVIVATELSARRNESLGFKEVVKCNQIHRQNLPLKNEFRFFN